jgi:hypothetical protein
MFKPIMRFILSAIAVISVTSILTSPSITPPQHNGTPTLNFVDEQLLRSSRYTQMDETNSAVLNRFADEFTLSYTPSQLDLMGFEPVMENESMKLYFEKDSFSVIMNNKISGYYWSSRAEYQGYSGSREDNTAARNLMNSGLWVDYVRTNSVSSSTIRTDSLYHLANVAYPENSGGLDLNNLDLTAPYLINQASYDRTKVTTTIQNTTSTSMDILVDIKALQISFKVNLTLTDTGLQTSFDTTTVNETGSTFRLLAVSLFPFLGSTREDVYPGYFVIPDGVGTLIRTNRRYDTSFQADFYGSDAGYRRTSIPQLSLPMYGVVHAVNQEALLVVIESGAEHASLHANFWGRSSRYHRIHTRFHYRKIFRQLINQAGDGFETIATEGVTTQFKIKYQLLNDQHANYIGVANAYRQSLINRFSLEPTRVLTQPSLHLAYLVNEQEPTFFGTSSLQMTSYSAIRQATERFQEAGITAQDISLLGWSQDGYRYRAPYQPQFIDSSGLNSFLASLNDEQHVYLAHNYTRSSELSRRVQRERDVARNYSKVLMEQRVSRLGSNPFDLYTLNPDRALAMWESDHGAFTSRNLGASFESMGSNLFSFFDGERQSRSATIEAYQSILSTSPSNLLAQANEYALPFMNGYLDMPITNAQYDYYSDLAPIIPTVLKGIMPAYTPYLNFNALGQDRLLQMIDFGIFPSYILTERPTSDMRFTLSNDFYTTALNDFEDEILTTYELIAQALTPVLNRTIVNREVLATGLVRVTYDHDVQIYINYAPYVQTIDGVTVAGQSFEVIQ